MIAGIDLATIWAFIIAFAVFVYVVMDGFDLGLGILFPLFPNKADRDVIMNSVAPVWEVIENYLGSVKTVRTRPQTKVRVVTG